MRFLSIELQLEFWEHASLGYFEKYIDFGHCARTGVRMTQRGMPIILQ